MTEEERDEKEFEEENEENKYNWTYGMNWPKMDDTLKEKEGKDG